MLYLNRLCNGLVTNHVDIQVIHNALDNFSNSSVVGEVVILLVICCTNLLVCQLHLLETDIHPFDFTLNFNGINDSLVRRSHSAVAVVESSSDSVIVIFKFFVCAANTTLHGRELATELSIYSFGLS